MGGGGQTSTQQCAANWFGPLGESGTSADALAKRSAILNMSNATQDQMQANSLAGMNYLTQQANNPALRNNVGMLNQMVQGANGQDAAVNRSLSQIMGQASRQGNDQAANIKSSFQRGGQSFGTANQEAQQAALASANANAMNTAAQTALQASQAQKNRALQASQQLPSALSTPASLYQQANTVGGDAAQRQAQLLMSLFANGTVNNPQIVQTQKPGLLSSVMNGIF